MSIISRHFVFFFPFCVICFPLFLSLSFFSSRGFFIKTWNPPTQIFSHVFFRDENKIERDDDNDDDENVSDLIFITTRLRRMIKFFLYFSPPRFFPVKYIIIVIIRQIFGKFIGLKIKKKQNRKYKFILSVVIIPYTNMNE